MIRLPREFVWIDSVYFLKGITRSPALTFLDGWRRCSLLTTHQPRRHQLHFLLSLPLLRKLFKTSVVASSVVEASTLTLVALVQLSTSTCLQSKKRCIIFSFVSPGCRQDRITHTFSKNGKIIRLSIHHHFHHRWSITPPKTHARATKFFAIMSWSGVRHAPRSCRHATRTTAT